MVKRLISMLNIQIGGLHEAAYLLAFFALLSHLLALVRDRLLAHNFGAGELLDIYYAAFRIPDFMFISVASVVSLFVLIPFLLDRVENNGQAQVFINTVFLAFFLFITVSSVIIFFFVPQLTKILFPGLADSAMSSDLILLTRIMLLSPILLGMSNILASITQVYKRFVVYAVSPLLYNIGIILGIVVFYPLFGMAGLAMGVVVGALMHVLVQIPVATKVGLLPRFTLKINIKELWLVVSTSLPRTFTLATNQIVLLFLISLASLMDSGSISVFNFAFNLQGVPLSIIGVSYSVAAFPTLAKLFSSGEKKKFLDQMVIAMRHILFWSFPAMSLFIVLRAQIVRTILGSGEFSWADTRLTAAVLALFVVSLVAQSLELLFVRGYYAAGMTKKPLIIKTITSVIIAVVAYFSVIAYGANENIQNFVGELLRISDVSGGTVVVLAFAYSVGMIINAIIFWMVFRKDFDSALPRSLYVTLYHSILTAIISGAVAYGALSVFVNILDINTFWGIFLQGLFSGSLGIGAGVLVLNWVGNPELHEIWTSLHHKFWKSQPIIPSQKEL